MPSLRTIPARSLTSRRLGAVSLAVGLVAASLSGCTFITQPDPATTDLESINLGANAELGEITVANLLLVTRGEGEPARLLGTLANNSDQPLTVTILDEDDSVTIALDASETMRLHDDPTLFETADDAPGARSTLTLTTETTSAAIPTPVRNGTLDSLAPYLPEEVDGP